MIRLCDAHADTTLCIEVVSAVLIHYNRIATVTSGIGA